MTHAQELHAARMRAKSTSLNMARKYKQPPVPKVQVPPEIRENRQDAISEARQRIDDELRVLDAIRGAAAQPWHPRREEYLRRKRAAMGRP
jgi:hypothetical protein